MRFAARQLFTSRRFLLAVGMPVALCCALFVCVFGFYYVKYRGIVDARLKKPLFDNTAKIYAAPAELRLGQKYTARFIAQQLRDAGYSIEGKAKLRAWAPSQLAKRALRFIPDRSRFMLRTQPSLLSTMA